MLPGTVAMLRGGRLTRKVTVPVSTVLLHDTGRYLEASEGSATDTAQLLLS